jgi:hypothetical protein
MMTTNTKLSDELHNLGTGFATFMAHLPPEVQPAFSELVASVHTLADSAISAEVTKVAGPIFSPIILPVVLHAVDSIITELTNAKAQLAPAA